MRRSAVSARQPRIRSLQSLNTSLKNLPRRKPRNDEHPGFVRFGNCPRDFDMSNDSLKPQGYGHDAKGKAGGQSAPDGKVNVAHTTPIGAVGGTGAGPKIIQFELDD